MKVFVAGATGVVGWRAVRELVAAGHEVTGLARTDDKAKLLDGLGAKPVTFDVFDAADVAAHAAGHDVVVNLLTHIPPDDEGARCRACGTRTTDCARRRRPTSPPRRATASHDSGEHHLSLWRSLATSGSTKTRPSEATSDICESSTAPRPTRSRSTGASCCASHSSIRAESHHTNDTVRMAAVASSPMPGKADGYWSMIHADDAARAVVAALDAPAGIYNVAEDEPLTRRAAAQLLAEALGKKKLRRTAVVAAFPCCTAVLG